jgi:hypothetical protein
MQDLDEMAVRAVFRRVVCADEPPVGALVGESLRAGLRLRRRRRLQAAGAGLAAVAVLAAGVPALAAALDAPPPTSPAGAASEGRVPRAHAPLPPRFHWVQPAVPVQAPVGRPAPATARSVASLLLAVLPAGTQTRYLAASMRDRNAAASVNVESVTGAGTVIAQMGPPNGSQLGSCAIARAADGAIIGCRDYSPSAGTKVQELVLAVGVGSGNRVAQGYSYVFSAAVRRVDGVTVTVQASDFVPGPSTAPPLSMSQVVAAAADPRWAWAMDGGFVARAARLRLTAPASGTCAQAQPAFPGC